MFFKKRGISFVIFLALALFSARALANDYQEPMDADDSMETANDIYQSVYAEQSPAQPPAEQTSWQNGDEIMALESAAPWSGVPNTQGWTQATISAVRENFSKFEKAKDRNTFCPGYDSATQTQKEICWLRLVGGVARQESNFNAGDMFKEPSGHWSVGLLALSPGECSNAPTLAALKDPTKNLICGARKMAGYIVRGGYISGPSHSRGASAYWSVLRAPYTYKKYKLGKKHLIIPITKRFKEF